VTNSDCLTGLSLVNKEITKLTDYFMKIGNGHFLGN